MTCNSYYDSSMSMLRLAVVFWASFLSAQQTPADRAATAFAANDCQTAIREYEAAAGETDDPKKLALFYRRIGICRARASETEPALAAYAKGMAAAEQAGDDELLTENIHGSVLMLRRLSRFAEAQELAVREDALATRVGKPNLVVRAMLVKADLAGDIGLRRESLRRYEEALAFSRHNNLEQAVDVCLHNLALRYGDGGAPSLGLRYMRETIARTPPDDVTAVASNYANLGFLHRRDGNETEAEAAFRKALAVATGPAQWRARMTALHNLGILLRDRKQWSEALRHFEEAQRLAAANKNPASEVLTQIELAGLWLEQQKPEAAAAHAERAQELAREIGARALVRDSLIVYGRVLEAQRKHIGALRVYDEALELSETLRKETESSPVGLRLDMERAMPAYRLAVRQRIRMGRIEEAFALAERAKARLLHDVMGTTKLSGPELSPEEKSEQARLLSAVQAARKKALASGSSRRSLERAESELELFRRRATVRHGEHVLQGGSFSPVTPERLGTVLGNGSVAAVSFLLADEAIAAFIVKSRPSRLSAVLLPWSEKLAKSVSQFRRELAARSLDYASSSQVLYRALIEPLAPALQGVRHVVLSPDGVLWELPFQVLMDRSGRHWIESAAISYTPSLTTLHRIRQGARSGSGSGVLSVGDAAVAKSQAALPETGREARDIAALYGSKLVLTGAEATVRRFEQEAAKARVIHVATHAELDGRYPLESFLSLTPAKDDGALTAQRIAETSLRASLVVLSACDTGLGVAGAGEGVLGFGWALAAAGARTAVLSQWKVDSDATADLMIDFHRRLAASRLAGKAEALRQAALAAMRKPARRHPFYWGAFVVTGDGR